MYISCIYHVLKVNLFLKFPDAMIEENVSNRFCTHSISGKDRTHNNSKNTRYDYYNDY